MYFSQSFPWDAASTLHIGKGGKVMYSLQQAADGLQPFSIEGRSVEEAVMSSVQSDGKLHFDM